MSEPVFDPDYWRDRLAVAVDREQMHHAVFICDGATWKRVAEEHRRALAQHVAYNTSILDVGCGWGRLLSLLPPTWTGDYLGIDICKDFIDIARRAHPERMFLRGDMRRPDFLELVPPLKRTSFDLAVLISIRPMVVREAGQDAWDAVERNVRRCCKDLLYMEYDGWTSLE